MSPAASIQTVPLASVPARDFSLLRALGAQASAEVRNRLRSPASLVTLLVILIGSYWAIPHAEGGAVSMAWELPDGTIQSPLYTAAYVGIAISTLTLMFFMFAGFYLVAGSVRRDRELGIGAIVAATPMTKASYLGAKFLAHFAYLSLLSLLVFPVGIYHFLRSGVGPFDLAAFCVPHFLMAIPAAAFIAASALLFDVTPVLRSRGGLVLWFLFGVLPLIALPMTMAKDPLNEHRVTAPPLFDPFGMANMAWWTQDSIPPSIDGVSMGYVFYDKPVERVPWKGVTFGFGAVWSRLLNLLWSLVPLGLAVLIFDRFDPARGGRGSKREAAAPMAVARNAAALPPPLPVPQRALATLPAADPRPTTWSAVRAEMRLLWESAHWSKWLLVPAVLAAALVPGEAARIASSVFLLLLVPVISEAACREDLAGARGLVFSQPGVPASAVLWKTAAVTLFLLVASLPLTVRGLLTSPVHAAAVPLGMLFVGSFAVAAASMTRGGKLFAGIYLLLWYLALNGLAAVDFCGVLAPTAGWQTRAVFLAIGTAMLAIALLWERRQRRA